MVKWDDEDAQYDLHVQKMRNERLVEGVRRDDAQGVKDALAQGADITYTDERDRTAIDWAERKGNPEILDVLRQHAAQQRIELSVIQSPPTPKAPQPAPALTVEQAMEQVIRTGPIPMLAAGLFGAEGKINDILDKGPRGKTPADIIAERNAGNRDSGGRVR